MTTPFHEVWFEAVEHTGKIVPFEVAKVGRVMFTLPSKRTTQRRAYHFRTWDEAHNHLVNKLTDRIDTFLKYVAADRETLKRVQAQSRPE